MWVWVGLLSVCLALSCDGIPLGRVKAKVLLRVKLPPMPMSTDISATKPSSIATSTPIALTTATLLTSESTSTTTVLPDTTASESTSTPTQLAEWSTDELTSQTTTDQQLIDSTSATPESTTTDLSTSTSTSTGVTEWSTDEFTTEGETVSTEGNDISSTKDLSDHSATSTPATPTHKSKSKMSTSCRWRPSTIFPVFNRKITKNIIGTQKNSPWEGCLVAFFCLVSLLTVVFLILAGWACVKVCKNQ